MGKIYFIFVRIDGKLIDECKIGKTKRESEKRKSELQTANAKKLVVYEVLNTPFPNQWEKFIHDYCETFNIGGEWYMLTPKCVDAIIKKIENFMEYDPYTIANVLYNAPANVIINNNNNITINQNENNNSNVTISNDQKDIPKKEETKIERDDDVICPRCTKKFSDKYKRKQHWKSSIPCDFICNKCGNRLNSYSSFRTHLDTKCAYIPKYTKVTKKNLN